MTEADELLLELQLNSKLAREDMLLNLRDKITREKDMVDVTGYWRGYNDQGLGLVEYRGRTYVCNVLARKVKQFGAKVNLRRTVTGNYVNWP